VRTLNDKYKQISKNPKQILWKQEILFGVKTGDSYKKDRYEKLDTMILNKSSLHLNTKVKKKNSRPWYDYLIITSNNTFKIIWDIFISILVGYSTITSAFYVAFEGPGDA